MAKNVIIVVPDGMGWEMARAGAIAQMIDEGHEGDTLDDFFVAGKGEGQSFMELEGFTWATTYPMTVDGSKSNSAFLGNPRERLTGEGELREGFNEDFTFDFDPTFNPEEDPDGGNLVGWDIERGGPNPWTTPDPEYIKLGYTGSSQAGTNIFTGVKTYNPGLGVDIFERPVESIAEVAKSFGKSVGTISDVPAVHATPASVAAHVNLRSKYDADFPNMDNILQQMLRGGEIDLMMGGGHPMDLGNHTEVGGEPRWTFITESNYVHLRDNPSPEDNRYGFTFLERGPDASQMLMDTVAELDPTEGDRIFGLYGARGQNGNLPMRSANDGSGEPNYDRVGFNTFGHRGSQLTSTDGKFVDPQYVRPLMPGETEEEFIARELNENPTIMEMTQASLDFLSKNEAGFFLQVELGDYDWVLHDNNMDTLIGRNLDLSETVAIIQDWIVENGGWEDNLLLVVPDHDHYLTLKEDFPALYRELGAEALTEAFEPMDAQHFWGANTEDKYEWGTHSNRPVPIYYQGAGSEILDGLIGQGYEMYGEQVPGIEGHIDLVHIFQTMKGAFELGAPDPAAALAPVFGSLNGDEFTVAGSDELVFAGAGDDLINAFDSTGGNLIFAGSGNDDIILGGGDTVNGGAGDDRFFAQTGGGNVLTGGAGADQFWIAVAELVTTPNIITDFTSGEDVLGIAGLGATFGSLSLGDMDGNATISFADTTLAMLNGVEASSLTAADFAFV
ncbi:MAG: alkaline phosphatase [Nodosilinea sp.]